jgi:6-phosphofructokinase 2
MSDILTITLNPAYDVSTSVGTVAPGPKLRCEPPRYDPGGGGVNVSRAISRLGGMSTAFVALGGQTGAMFHALLDAEDFEVAQFEIDGNTRQSLAVIETSTRRQYRFQLPGPDWRPEQTAAMLEHLRPHLTRGRIVVMSGSLPPGVPADIAATVNRIAVECGSRLILDTSGAALVAAAPIPVRPLRCSGWTGRKPPRFPAEHSPRPPNWPITGLTWSRQAWLSSW